MADGKEDSSLQEVSKLDKPDSVQKPNVPGQRDYNHDGDDAGAPGGGAGLRKLNSRFDTKFISEAGSLPVNRDYFGFVELDNYACWAVGESYDQDPENVSAKIAVETVLDLFTRHPGLSKFRLRRYIREAHRQLKLRSERFLLKASIMVVATDYRKVRYAHCGNTRLFIFRGNNAIHTSEDQSLYQDMLRSGEIPYDDGEEGLEEGRNLFEFLGKYGYLRVKASRKIALSGGDTLVIATWGFWEKVSFLEMLDALEGTQDNRAFLDDLQDLLLSKQGKRASGIKNYTVVSIAAEKLYRNKNNRRKIVIIAVIVVAVLLIAGLILFFYFRNAAAKRADIIKNISAHETNGDMHTGDKNYGRALDEYTKGVTAGNDLRETTGKKGEENQALKDALTTRERTAQLIVDGDSLFAAGQYTDAKQNYQKALTEAKGDQDFYDKLDAAGIQNKIENCDNYDYIDKLTALAGQQSGMGQDADALGNYNVAADLALKAGNTKAQQDIKLKIDAINSKITADKAARDAAAQAAAQKAQDDKIKAIQKDELNADQASMAGDYTKAADMYTQASQAYAGAGDMDKANAARQKAADMRAALTKQQNDEQIKIADGYVKDGDNFMIQNDFQNALKSYSQAKDVYAINNAPADAAKVDAKIDAANTKITEAGMAEKQMQIDAIASEGDGLLSSGNYQGAKDKYMRAQTLYKGINATDQILAMQEKIKSADGLIRAQGSGGQSPEQKYYAKTQELNGDQAVKTGDKDAALKYYQTAKKVYESIGDYDAALAVQAKVLAMNHPAAQQNAGSSEQPVSSPTPSPTGSTQSSSSGDPSAPLNTTQCPSS